MRVLRLPAFLSVLALLVLGCRETKLEHFKFYEVTPGAPLGSGTAIELEGQFDDRRITPSIVALTHFGNPVSKVRLTPTPTPSDEQPPEAPGEEEAPEPPPQPGPLANPSHHLAWYKLEEKGETRYVKVTDQFGTKELLVDKPVALLVPAHKLEAGGRAPEGLNHFKCYDIVRHRGAAREVVILRDQFDRPGVQQADVRDPRFFCLPVKKRHAGDTYKIQRNTGPYNHLLIYSLEPSKEYDVRKTATDQLRDRRNPLSGFRSRYLAVPAKKESNWPATEFPTPTPTPPP